MSCLSHIPECPAHNPLSDLESLKPKTRELLPSGISSDLTADYYGNVLFLTHVFADGHVLGFWSHSPWSGVQDKEQGWAVIDPQLDVVSYCETRTDGLPAGNDFRDWRREQKELHGRAFKLCPEWENSLIWKITEC